MGLCLLFCLSILSVLIGLFYYSVFPFVFILPVLILSQCFASTFCLDFFVLSIFTVLSQYFVCTPLPEYSVCVYCLKHMLLILPLGLGCKCVHDEAKVRNWATRTWFRVLWDFCSQTRHWSYCLMLMALQSETRLRTQLKNCFSSWRSVEFCRAALESHEPASERSEQQKRIQKKVHEDLFIYDDQLCLDLDSFIKIRWDPNWVRVLSESFNTGNSIPLNKLFLRGLDG